MFLNKWEDKPTYVQKFGEGNSTPLQYSFILVYFSCIYAIDADGI